MAPMNYSKVHKRFTSYRNRFAITLGFILFLCQPGKSQEVAPRFELFPDTTTLWGAMPINVCWENSSRYLEERNWVRNVVQREFDRTGVISFSGWNQCVSQESGIRIQISDVGPHVKYLGRNLNGKPNGMVLNFDFKNWSKGCGFSKETRQDCIENVAIHEFGHAIGLAHEQNRPDTFGVNVFNACSDAPQGSNGNLTIGPWDPDSVMNYCNESWTNNGILSAWDVEGIQRLYGRKGRVADLGYIQPPRAMVDVNRDGIKDYCRVVGDSPKLFISCKLAYSNGFSGQDGEYAYNSIQNIDLGHASLPRYFADVNGDSRPDYCRFVGDSPNIFLSCNLGEANGFSADQYAYNSVRGIDQGYAHFRALVDVNGDKRADYCRFVGDSPNVFLACTLAGASGFSSDVYSFRSVNGIDQGYASLPRVLQDADGDGKSDYCRYVGDKPNIFFACNKSQNSSFDPNQYSITRPPDRSAEYNQ